MRISDWSSDVCSSDLVRLAQTPHGRAPDQDIKIHATVCNQFVDQRSFYIPWCDGIDPDTMPGPFNGKHFGQHGDRSLAGAISRSFWCGIGAVHGRYVQDDDRTLPDHISVDGQGAVETTIYITLLY